MPSWRRKAVGVAIVASTALSVWAIVSVLFLSNPVKPCPWGELSDYWRSELMAAYWEHAPRAGEKGEPAPVVDIENKFWHEGAHVGDGDIFFVLWAVGERDGHLGQRREAIGISLRIIEDDGCVLESGVRRRLMTWRPS